jgi:hypothetical protein
LKRSIRRFALIWAKTGSTMHWRFGIELATGLAGHHSSHEVIGAAEPGLPRSVSGRQLE